MNKTALIAALLVATLTGFTLTGYRTGVKITEGRYAIGQQQAIDAAHARYLEKLNASVAREQAATRARDTLARKIKEIDREQAVPDRDCRRWTDAEHRLLESRRATYNGHPDPAPGALSGAMPGHAVNSSGRTGDRDRPAGLGLRLPGEATGVRGTLDGNTTEGQ